LLYNREHLKFISSSEPRYHSEHQFQYLNLFNLKWYS